MNGGQPVSRTMSVLGALLVAISSDADGQRTGPALVNPVPELIARSGVAVVIEDYLVLPASSRTFPRARINQVRYAPGDTGRMFVNDLRGRLHVVAGGAISTYLDVSAEMPDFVDSPGLGGGFGSFAFHPGFASNGLLYTVHTESPGDRVPDLTGPAATEDVVHGVITEWRASNAAAGTFAGEHREVLRIGFPLTIHGIQEIAFKPGSTPGSVDYGLLYVGVGEGGSVISEITDNSGRLDSALGTILRIDPTLSDAGAYSVPPDNPWASDGDSSTLAEIWALGFRNPHRFSWDTGGGGAMLIADIGENNVEEINMGVAGANYGWPAREGTFGFDPLDPPNVFLLPLSDRADGYTYPIAQYDHDEGNATGSGFVYRGRNVPDLFGHYVFGDIPNGRIFHFDIADIGRGVPVTVRELTLTRADGRYVSVEDLVAGSRVDLRLGLDHEGELLVLTKSDGGLRRLIGPSATVTLRPDLTDDDQRTLGEDFEREWISDGSGSWRLSDGKLVLGRAGGPSGAIRRPAALAILRDHVFGDVTVEAEIRSTAPRDVIEADMQFVFGYQSPTRFYYVHLSGITNRDHNGIFVVDGADRRRISDLTSAPQLRDREWHSFRLERDVASGRIAVYLDGDDTPGLVAFDRSLGPGAVGFGSFDDTGEVRNVVVRGVPVPLAR
jgi:glucose/arabinose dehydrogenase